MTDFRISDNFLSYTIKLSTKVEAYSRSFAKVQNIAAEAGGLLKMISITCLAISHYYTKAKFYQFVGQEIMSEKIKEEKNAIVDKNLFYSNNKQRKDYSKSHISRFKSGNNTKINNAIVNNASEEYREFEKNVGKKLKINFNENSNNINFLDNSNNNININCIKNDQNINKNFDVNFLIPANKSNQNSPIDKTSKKMIATKGQFKEIPLNNKRIYDNFDLKDPEKHNKNLINSKKEKAKRFKIKISFCESFLNFSRCCTHRKNKNLQKLNVISYKVDEQMDILNLFRTINDFERLKELILDDDELKLFNLPYFLEINVDELQTLQLNKSISSISHITELQHKKDEYENLLNSVALKNNFISNKLVNLVNF